MSKRHDRLTVRDQMAMAVLNGMISSPPIVERTKVNKMLWSRIAYKWADCMMLARQMPKP